MFASGPRVILVLLLVICGGSLVSGYEWGEAANRTSFRQRACCREVTSLLLFTRPCMPTTFASLTGIEPGARTRAAAHLYEKISSGVVIAGDKTKRGSQII